MRQIAVREQSIVAPLGERRRLRVFCPLRGHSRPFAQCLSCPRLREPPAHDGAPIVCDAPKSDPPVGETARALAEGLFVADLVPERVLCVQRDLPLGALPPVFARERAVLLPVVDARERFCGVLWRPDLSVARPHPLPPSLCTAGDAMDTRASVLAEGAPAADAVRAMVVDRARAVVAVDRAGAVLGVARDLDLLRWFAFARQST